MSRKISEADLDRRKSAVVKAATDVFLRYGYGRSTMADLAAAAQLSRPSLYEIFPGKDDLFSAVIRQLSAETLEDFRRVSPKLRTLRAKLHRFCGEWATHGIRLTEQHPDAKDLFDLEFPAVGEMYEDFIRFLIEVMAKEPYTSSVPLAKVVRNLVFSLRGLKEAADTTAAMEELVDLQVDIFLTMLIPKKTRRKIGISAPDRLP